MYIFKTLPNRVSYQRVETQKSLSKFLTQLLLNIEAVHTLTPIYSSFKKCRISTEVLPTESYG